ncbi:hypothetical protein BaRGS_00039410, partial [Batillaria attramentaria]
MAQVVIHKDFYAYFATDDQDVVGGVYKFVLEKEYNTNTCDLLLSVLSNALESTVNIFQFQDQTQGFMEMKLSPGRPGVEAKYTVSLVRTGDGIAAHYSALLPFSSRQALDFAQLHPPAFSPEEVQPHPKVLPRLHRKRGRRTRA